MAISQSRDFPILAAILLSSHASSCKTFPNPFPFSPTFLFLSLTQVSSFFTGSYIQPLLSINTLIQASTTSPPSASVFNSTNNFAKNTSGTSLQYLLWSAFKANNQTAIFVAFPNLMYISYSFSPSKVSNANNVIYIMQYGILCLLKRLSRHKILIDC